MKIIPKGSIVVTDGGEFRSFRRGVAVVVPDAMGARLVTAGLATAVGPEEAPGTEKPSANRSGKRVAKAPENKLQG